MSKFSGIMEKMKKNKKLIIVGVILLAVVIGVAFVTASVRQKAEQMKGAINQVQTSQVEKRTLVSSVSATGTLTSVNSKEVVVNLSGVEVESVSVQLGDMVEVGQVLCEFDSEDIEESLSEAKTALNVANQKTQMDLTAAERNLADAKEDYDIDLKRGNTDLDVAYNDYVLALEDVEEAESAWNSAKENMYMYLGEYEYRQNLVNQKKAELDAVGGSSEANVQLFNTKRSELEQYASDNRIELKNSVMDTKIGLGEENNMDAITIGSSGSEDFYIVSSGDDISEKKVKIEGLIAELKIIKSNYNTSRQLEQEYVSLQQEAANMQSKYNAAVQNESSAEKAYEQAVSASQSELSAYQKQQRALDDTAKSAENNVINKTESLTTAQLNALSSGNSEEDKVEQYQQQLDDCTVEAPISGVISAVNIEAGDTYNGTAIVTIDDISSFEVTAEIDEYDIGKIEKGQKVVIKTNATGDEELEGTVKIVSPKASTGGNEVTYTVIISVDTPNEMLRMDMTAKLSIILESKENVLTVPYEAVQEDESGNVYVEVVGDGGENIQNTVTNSKNETKENKIEDSVSANNVPVSGKEQAGAGPEGMDSENMLQMPESMSEGKRSQGMKIGNNLKKTSGSSDENTETTTRRIYIEKGIESDYYIEIISDEITEGMEVVVPKTEDDFSNIQNMMRRQGPMGGF